jgi:hypothetical protein
MSQATKEKTVQVSNRRNHVIRDVPDDVHIFTAFARYVFLTADQLTRLLGRNEWYVQKRLKSFYDAGYLNNTQDGPFGPMMYFLSFKGGEKCVNLGILEKPRYVFKKSPKSIAHDSLITEFHLALELALRGPLFQPVLEKTGWRPINSLTWEQWRDDMTDLAHLIPDARFAVVGDEDFTLVEVVRANISKPKDKEDELTSKLIEYERLGIKRVLILMPTKTRTDNYVKKLSLLLPSTIFWVTDYDSWKEDVLGKIFRTPKNYETRMYSILKPEIYT